MAQTLDLRCGLQSDPSTQGAGGPNQNSLRIHHIGKEVDTLILFFRFIFTFFGVSLALMKLMPGGTHYGPASPKGNIPVYKSNGVQSFLFHTALFVLCSDIGPEFAPFDPPCFAYFAFRPTFFSLCGVVSRELIRKPRPLAANNGALVVPSPPGRQQRCTCSPIAPRSVQFSSALMFWDFIGYHLLSSIMLCVWCSLRHCLCQLWVCRYFGNSYPLSIIYDELGDILNALNYFALVGGRLDLLVVPYTVYDVKYTIHGV